MTGEQLPPGQALPPYGWLNRHPIIPTTGCRWCARPWSYLHGYRVCVGCDSPPRVTSTLTEKP